MTVKNKLSANLAKAIALEVCQVSNDDFMAKGRPTIATGNAPGLLQPHDD